MSRIRGFFRQSKENQSTSERGAVLAAQGLGETRVTVRGDNPIRSPGDDTLGRAKVAQSFAQQLLEIDASEGVVVGVLGPWGSGKTSFVNLARRGLEEANVPVLEFNPWMFSGAQQLVESFFVELSAQLKVRPGLDALAGPIEDYGEAFSGMGWLPIAGPWIERGRAVTKIIGAALKRRKEGVGARRTKIEKALASLTKPIVICLDDIDRLSTSEIRDVFKLVRLTASFPNLIYILAFDRIRVEQALGEQGVSGRAYLEKILQVAIDLPSVAPEVFTRQLASSIEKALAGIDNCGPFNEQLWPDVFAEIIHPLIQNMRDVRRYSAAIRGTVVALQGQVALVDVLGLEAARVFLPDVFAQFHRAIDGLTTTTGSSYGGYSDGPELKAQVNGLIDVDKARADIVRNLIRRLFPAGQRHIGGSQYPVDWKIRWLRERRVAHEDILRFYLERIAGEGLRSFADAEQAWARFADHLSLNAYLRSLEKERLQDVIASLEVYEDQFRPEHVVPATIVLLDILPDLPERQRSMFELGSSFVVSRVTFRLLRSLKDPAAVETAVRQILPKLSSLSSKLELLTQIGYRENAGHTLVTENVAAELEKSWRDEVRASSVEQLLQERDIASVLLLAKKDAGPSEVTLNINNSPDLTMAILRASRREVQSQTMGNRSIRRTACLSWDALVELYGDETALRERINRLKRLRSLGTPVTSWSLRTSISLVGAQVPVTSLEGNGGERRQLSVWQLPRRDAISGRDLIRFQN
jgi:predicted KAP-like P-loop ATPase